MFHWISVLAYAGLIFYLSAQPYLGVPHEIIFLDPQNLMLHILEFLPLGFLAARAFAMTPRFSDFHPAVLPVLLGSSYGLGDELHQFFVPGRTASIFDAAADSMGVVIGVFLWIWFSGKSLGHFEDVFHRAPWKN